MLLNFSLALCSLEGENSSVCRGPGQLDRWFIKWYQLLLISEFLTLNLEIGVDV